MARYVISQLTMPDGNVMELKDKVARDAIAGGSFFLGVTSTEIVDGSSITTVIVAGEEKTASNGAIVVCGVKEFIFAEADGRWHELGDVSMLGSLAVKNSAAGIYTPRGSVSSTFTGANISYTPAGTVSKPDVDVTSETIAIREFDSVGSVTAGSAASCELPTLSMEYDGENDGLTVSWMPGIFTPNTPTEVTLPTPKETSVMAGATAELHEAPEFVGTQDALEVTGMVESTFSGTAATIIVE